MGADISRVYVGFLDITALARLLSLDVSRYTAGTFQYVPRYGVTVGSWSCSIKRAIGVGAPQAFATAMAFTSSAIAQPAADAADLSGTDAVVFTTDTVGSAGTVDVWAILKSDK